MKIQEIVAGLIAGALWWTVVSLLELAKTEPALGLLAVVVVYGLAVAAFFMRRSPEVAVVLWVPSAGWIACLTMAAAFLARAGLGVIASGHSRPDLAGGISDSLTSLLAIPALGIVALSLVMLALLWLFRPVRFPTIMTLLSIINACAMAIVTYRALSTLFYTSP